MTPKGLKRTLVIKERLRQVKRAELMEAEARVNDARTALAEQTARHQGTAAQLTRQGEHSAGDLALYSQQLEHTQRALKEASKALEECEDEREQRRDVVGEATREVKAIDALRARLVAEQRKQLERREQAELDEASARKGRQHK
jgi:flagellar export protein FliJ